MLEINIRIFFPKKGNSLFPDYHEHLKLLEPLDGQIRTCLDGAEAAPIYQYYTISPLGWVESRYLRRMRLGKSVMCIREDLREYTNSIHVPGIFRQLLYQYLKMYLNSLDYIVVKSQAVEDKLKKEGVRSPTFFKIPEKDEKNSIKGAYTWLNLYKKIETIQQKF